MKKLKIKNVKKIGLVILSIFCVIFCYSLVKPQGNKSELKQLAVMLQQDDGTYVKTSLTNFNDYIFDHAVCNNGSTITVNPNGGLNVKFLGADKCTIYLNSKIEMGLSITGITVDGKSSTTVPTVGYEVTPTCTGGTAEWNYETGGLNIYSDADKISCSLAYTKVNNPKYISDYIKTLDGQTVGNNGEVLKHEGDYTILSENEYSNVDQDVCAYYDDYEDCSYADVFLFNSNTKKWESNYIENNGNSNASCINMSVLEAGYYQLYYSIEKGNSNYLNIGNRNIYSSINQKNEGSIDFGYFSANNRITICHNVSGRNSAVAPSSFYLQKSDVSNGIDAGYRYEGENPNNYVKYNNELWRIIGTFETTLADGTTKQWLTKIIRNEPIGGLPYNNKNLNYWEKTDGTKASLNLLLNNYYYNAQDGTTDDACKYRASLESKAQCNYKQIGLHLKSRNMAQNVIWYLNGTSTNTITYDERRKIYLEERSESSYNNEYKMSTSGIVGLMYASDYLFSQNDSGNRWLLKFSNDLFLTPQTSDSSKIYNTSYYNDGRIWTNDAQVGNNIRPTLYLKNNVYIISGTGTINDPYILNM